MSVQFSLGFELCVIWTISQNILFSNVYTRVTHTLTSMVFSLLLNVCVCVWTREKRNPLSLRGRNHGTRPGLARIQLYVLYVRESTPRKRTKRKKEEKMLAAGRKNPITPSQEVIPVFTRIACRQYFCRRTREPRKCACQQRLQLQPVDRLILFFSYSHTRSFAVFRTKNASSLFIWVTRKPRRSSK